MSQHYDDLESRAPAAREADLMARLPAQIRHAQQHSPAFASILQGVDAARITSRAALARLPVTRKHELLERQKAERAQHPGRAIFGGFNTAPFGRAMPRMFASPGPIYEPEGQRPDYWRMARAIYAAGFRAGELVHNSFSYHFVPAGSMMESGAQALGATVFPAGTGQTEQQVQAMADLHPHGYIGTPSFLKIILEKAEAQGQRIASLTKALVSGEACPPSLRDWFSARGVAAYQCYATADLGLIAYETEAREGLVLDENVIVEIVRPGTGDPVSEGEVGEVVVTSLDPHHPRIRLALGDLTAVMPGQSPCGRTNTRIRGWMGRADQTAKIKGMFVRPEQVAEIARRHAEIAKLRLVVGRAEETDTMTLKAEIYAEPAGLVDAVASTLQQVTKLKGRVEVLPLGALPNDGKVIADERPVG